MRRQKLGMNGCSGYPLILCALRARADAGGTCSRTDEGRSEVVGDACAISSTSSAVGESVHDCTHERHRAVAAQSSTGRAGPQPRTPHIPFGRSLYIESARQRANQTSVALRQRVERPCPLFGLPARRRSSLGRGARRNTPTGSIWGDCAWNGRAHVREERPHEEPVLRQRRLAEEDVVRVGERILVLLQGSARLGIVSF